ncbi:MAG: hypothetical protein ACRD6W_07065, partial [Nitrososphaerales archaeon]
MYVVDGLPFWKPSATFRSERRASRVTAAVPEVGKRYPGGTPPITAGTSLKVHSGPLAVWFVVEELEVLVDGAPVLTVKVEGTLAKTVVG